VSTGLSDDNDDDVVLAGAGQDRWRVSSCSHRSPGTLVSLAADNWTHEETRWWARSHWCGT